MSSETIMAIFYVFVVMPSYAVVLYRAWSGEKFPKILVCCTMATYSTSYQFENDTIIRAFIKVFTGE